ncbi:hypothetical protein TWF225_006636 [Orbilia oligospora]|uniref:Uncharacterized protein n=1 Tax=Orbilia oligospora TaxID=2813651 RepID=A0A7C8PA47_ORBOL|nr:hypothetical protein TWF751_007946 [Orbilia oligospora]KAF3181595.1 hypothetical protein TWF225_006636 [Orbilia oligospora]KAF3253303.1 hypothetical protein TWF217_007559 [Orbilia oligospora]KAF3255118.1 hypothetical protein TWF128_005926 [Orbilia oligospora]KAF3298289.1 hypothetical protein TWF132_000118 [Orbilia oligospora]
MALIHAHITAPVDRHICVSLFDKLTPTKRSIAQIPWKPYVPDQYSLSVSIKAQYTVSRLRFRIARGLVAISPASLKGRRMIGIAEAYALVYNNKTKIGSGELLAS